MKNQTIILLAQLAICIGMGFMACDHHTSETKEQTTQLVCQFDSLRFNVDNVIETFGYDDSAWYMTYDDIDTGCDFEVIRIDRRTHDMIVKAQDNKQPLIGILKATKPCEVVRYVLEVESPKLTVEIKALTDYSKCSEK